MSQNHHHYNQHQYRRNCMPELGSYCSDYAACRMMRDSNPGKDNFIFFKKTSGRALGSTQPPDQWVSDSFPGIKRSGYEVFQKASMYCRGYERVELTLCSLYIPSWHGQGHLWPYISTCVLDCIWNVMAHAQKPDFVFRRNGRVHLNRQGRQFIRLLAAEVCASAVVMLDTPCSQLVWRVLATHSIRQFPHSLPLPCFTVCHHISPGV